MVRGMNIRSVNMAHSGLQLGTLGWSVNFKSFFDSAQNVIQAGSEAFAVPRVLAQGTRAAFERVTLVAVLCYTVQALTAGGFAAASASSHLARSAAYNVVYMLAFLLVQATGGVCQTAIRVMVVKQGIECTNAGRAELNAAFAGLGKITQMFMPLVWAACLKFYSNDPVGRSWWLRWGSGGHLLLVGIGRLLSYMAIRSARPEDLFLSDASPSRKSS
jgi:hypothetical protein